MVYVWKQIIDFNEIRLVNLMFNFRHKLFEQISFCLMTSRRFFNLLLNELKVELCGISVCLRNEEGFGQFGGRGK